MLGPIIGGAFGLGSALLGGDNETTVTRQLSPAEQKLQTLLADQIEKAVEQSGTYIPYPGLRIAPIAPETQVAGDIIRRNFNLGLSPLLSAQQQLERLSGQPITVDRAGTGRFDTAAAQQYMNPFEQEVADIVLRDLERQQGRSKARLNQQGRSASALGGSGFGLARANMERDFLENIQDARTKLRSAAFDRAADLFQRDESRDLEAQRANIDSMLRAQQLASNIGLGAAGQLAALGPNMMNTLLQGTSALSGVGEMYQNQAQRNLDLAYQDFINQRDYPFEVANRIGAAGQALPSSASQTTTGPAPNPFSSILGGAIAGSQVLGGLNFPSFGSTSIPMPSNFNPSTGTFGRA